MNLDSKHRSKITNAWYDNETITKKHHIFLGKSGGWLVIWGKCQIKGGHSLRLAIKFKDKLNRTRAKS